MADLEKERTGMALVDKYIEPADQLAEAAAVLGRVSGELAKLGGILVEARNQLRAAEGNVASSQVEWEEAHRTYRNLLSQHGLLMDITETEPTRR